MGCPSLGSRSRIDLLPIYRPVANSSTVVTAHQLLSAWSPPSVPPACLCAVHAFVNAGLILRRSQMPEPEWMNLVKCGFGVYERRSLLLCSSCSVNYYDYCELSASCDCCSQTAGNNRPVNHLRSSVLLPFSSMFFKKFRKLVVDSVTGFHRMIISSPSETLKNCIETCIIMTSWLQRSSLMHVANAWINNPAGQTRVYVSSICL